MMNYVITQLIKTESKFWLCDIEFYGEKLYLGGKVREVLNIPKVVESEEEKYDVNIQFTVKKWDGDLPCYVHEVEIKINNEIYNGRIIGDKGMRTGEPPLLKIK